MKTKSLKEDEVKSLLILDNGQFGYNASTFNYSRYIQNYKIKFLSVRSR